MDEPTITPILALWVPLLIFFTFLLIGLVAAWQKRGHFVRGLLTIRFQLFIAGVLVALPLIAQATGASQLIGNLVVLEKWGLLFVTAISLLSAWAVATTTILAWRDGPKRFLCPPGELPRWLDTFLSRFRLAVGSVPALPLVIVAASASLEHKTLEGFRPLIEVLAGTAAALAVLILVAMAREWLVGDSAPPARLLAPDRLRLLRWARDRRSPLGGRFYSAIGRLADRAGEGFSEKNEKGEISILPGHLFAAVLLVVSFIGYAVIGLAAYPGGSFHDRVPALLYLLALLLLAAWLLPGLSFTLDRWRVPVVLVLAVLSVLFYTNPGTAHHYPTHEAERAKGAAPTPRDAMEAWLQNREPGTPLTVVAASGGGITAALWTSTVLTELEQRYGAPFVDSLGLLSTVSGGSVGALHYLSGSQCGQGLRQGTGEARGGDCLREIRQGAGATSLSATTWGFAYPDLWRSILAWVGLGRFDRAWAMERLWAKQLPDSDEPKLQDWWNGIRSAEIPPVIFNAFLADTGEQFLLSPVALPPADRDSAAGEQPAFRGYRSFQALYPERDLSTVTAARLSATFPWVSPMASADSPAKDGERHYVADGGYYDNYGIATSVSWIDEVLPPAHEQQRAPTTVVILQIVAYRAPRVESGAENAVSQPDADGRAPSSAGNGSAPERWAYAYTGPLIGLMKARSGSQATRNFHELRRLERRWRRDGVEIYHLPIHLAEDSSLSWHLTQKEQNQIIDYWKVIEQNRLERLDQLFQPRAEVAPPPDPPPSDQPPADPPPPDATADQPPG